ncbi:MAG TPA: hypothetical protein VN739_07810 [Nitrososphaerales archaeon]|nr:hypothetical protein [Nitrososphaerales archaeon]
MVSIDVSSLDSDLKDDVVAFIESKLPVKSDKDGDVITFDDKSPRSHVTSPEVRTYLKRFLHSKDLKKQFRLLSEDGSLTFVKQKLEKDDEEEKEKEASSSKKE